MLQHHQITVLVLILALAVAAIAGYDVWLYSQGGTPATISHQIYLWATSCPFCGYALVGSVTFFLGGLAYHLLVP